MADLISGVGADLISGVGAEVCIRNWYDPSYHYSRMQGGVWCY